MNSIAIVLILPTTTQQQRDAEDKHEDSGDHNTAYKTETAQPPGALDQIVPLTRDVFVHPPWIGLVVVVVVGLIANGHTQYEKLKVIGSYFTINC